MEKITNQKEALIFLIKRLYSAEQELHHFLPEFIDQVSSESLKFDLLNYHQTESKKMVRFVDLFKTLNEPIGNKLHQHVADLLHELRLHFEESKRPLEKDQFFISQLQSITDHKISDYLACYHFANELEEIIARDLIKEMLDQEREMGWQLAQMEIASLSNVSYSLEE